MFFKCHYKIGNRSCKAFFNANIWKFVKLGNSIKNCCGNLQYSFS